jgi:hypothetical protein
VRGLNNSRFFCCERGNVACGIGGFLPSAQLSHFVTQGAREHALLKLLTHDGPDLLAAMQKRLAELKRSVAFKVCFA